MPLGCRRSHIAQGILSASAVLVIRGELDGRLDPDHGSTALVSETADSKSSGIDPAHDVHKELTHLHSVRRLAHWIGLSSKADFPFVLWL